jgi:hypothetical protein
MNVVIFPNFLTIDDCGKLNDWAKDAIKKSIFNFGLDPDNVCRTRLTTRLSGNRFDYPSIVYLIAKRIEKFLQIEGFKKRLHGGKNGIIVNYVMTNGGVFNHIDAKQNGNHILTCNIMTSSASSGGELYIGGEKINIKAGDLHCYLPSDVEHYVTENTGERARIMWMFGYQMSKEDFKRHILNKSAHEM